MTVAVAEAKTLDGIARQCLDYEKSIADYDEPLFHSPESREKLLDFARTIVLCPEAVAKPREESRSLYEVFDHIVHRGLWKEEKFSELASKLLSHKDPNVRALFVDCLRQIGSWSMDSIFRNNPDLPEKIIRVMESGATTKTISQGLGILSAFSGLTPELADRLIDLIGKNPKESVLSSAAYCFASRPDGRVSAILSDNLSALSDEFLRDNGGQAVLRYLLRNAPSSELMVRSIKAGMKEHVEYPGHEGVLEAAIHIRSRGSSPLINLKETWNRMIGKSFGPDNYTEKAAVESIAGCLKCLQRDELLISAFKALKRCKDPAAKDYLQSIQAEPGLVRRFISYIAGNFENLTTNAFRKIIFERCSI